MSTMSRTKTPRLLNKTPPESKRGVGEIIQIHKNEVKKFFRKRWIDVPEYLLFEIEDKEGNARAL